MNIQIFGSAKCFDTKKAERYFKERGVRFQSIDLRKFGISRGELQSVMTACGGLDALLDPKNDDARALRYFASVDERLARVLDDPSMLRTPIVRNGRQATVGYAPETWKAWE